MTITTDPLNEIFPVVDTDDIVIGQTTRQNANSNPSIIHRSINILIYNLQGELLIQQRSPTKDTYPNTWAVGVGGHVEFGDDYISTAIREISEELGLSITSSELRPLGKTLIQMPSENEYSQIYEYHATTELVINPSPSEISKTKFVSISEMKSMLADPSINWNPFSLAVLKAFPLI
jgi:isopentenyl-diphosphate delta-isomerase type 1